MKKRSTNVENLSLLAGFFGEDWYLGRYNKRYHFNSYDKKGFRLISLLADTAKELADKLKAEIDSYALKPIKHRQKAKRRVQKKGKKVLKNNKS